MISRNPHTSPRPLSTRPLDALWTVWFAVHLVVMFCVDMVGIYPPWLTPEPLLSLRRWYIATYHDRFFVAPPAWFNLFIYLEAIYHVPLSAWAIKALKEGMMSRATSLAWLASWRVFQPLARENTDSDGEHPLVPLQLLIWSIETFVTTLVCVTDIIFWPDITNSEIQGLCGLYVPYCVLSLVIGVDMFSRLKRKLVQQVSLKQE